jgi:hypothetical protein
MCTDHIKLTNFKNLPHQKHTTKSHSKKEMENIEVKEDGKANNFLFL